MFATRWEPLLEMNQLHRDMNRLFRDATQRSPRYAPKTYPTLNLTEDENNYYVEAELPGLRLEDLTLHVFEGNQLSIEGERQKPTADDTTWHRQERGYGKFKRTIALPENVDSENVSATLVQGVLTVSLPKHPKSKPRKITVTAD